MLNSRISWASWRRALRLEGCMWWPGEEGRDRMLDRGKSKSKGMKQPQETEGGSWFGITKAAGWAELRLGAGAARREDPGHSSGHFSLGHCFKGCPPIRACLTVTYSRRPLPLCISAILESLPNTSALLPLPRVASNSNWNDRPIHAILVHFLSQETMWAFLCTQCLA